MNSQAVRADFFDASALAKIFSDDHHSDVARTYFGRCPTKYTTPFCFYETMNVLKGKWRYKHQLTFDQYLDAAFRLTAWYGASSSRISDLDFTDSATFVEAKYIAERNGLDLSDAFQILSVSKGYFSGLVNDSSTVLVTADRALAVAARKEGLRAWDLMHEPAPA